MFELSSQKQTNPISKRVRFIIGKAGNSSEWDMVKKELLDVMLFNKIKPKISWMRNRKRKALTEIQRDVLSGGIRFVIISAANGKTAVFIGMNASIKIKISIK